jgi:UDP-glucose 4-epimerase
VAIDDLRSGALDNLPLAQSNLHFEQLSIGDPLVVERIQSHVAQSDLVFHLAGPVGVGVAHRNPIDTATSIVLSGLQMVDLCRRYRRPLLFASSSEVYGAASAHPISEGAPLTLTGAPRFSYAAAKFVVEHLVTGLYNQCRVPSWIVRFFNVAGPRQRPMAGVVASLAEDAYRDKALLIHGDGTQTRCFLHVADAVEAVARVATCAELVGRAVNVGGDESVSINALAVCIQSQVGNGQAVARVDYTDAFGEGFHPVHKRVPDTHLLRSATGWRPRFRLSDIVRDCLAEYASLDRQSG